MIGVDTIQKLRSCMVPWPRCLSFGLVVVAVWKDLPISVHAFIPSWIMRIVRQGVKIDLIALTSDPWV